MPTKRTKSKACLTVDLQKNGRVAQDGITSIHDTTISILQSKKPTKGQKKYLITAAVSLLGLQKAVVDEIPELVPNEYTKYALKQLHTTNSNEILTHSQERPPCENMRVRKF